MDTFNIIREAHKGFGYLILVAALVFIVALLMAMFGYSGKISKLLKKSTLFTMILFHLQFLIGIAMLVFSPGLKAALESGTLMSDSYNRVTFVEHPFSNAYWKAEQVLKRHKVHKILSIYEPRNHKLQCVFLNRLFQCPLCDISL